MSIVQKHMTGYNSLDAPCCRKTTKYLPVLWPFAGIVVVEQQIKNGDYCI